MLVLAGRMKTEMMMMILRMSKRKKSNWKATCMNICGTRAASRRSTDRPTVAFLGHTMMSGDVAGISAVSPTQQIIFLYINSLCVLRLGRIFSFHFFLFFPQLLTHTYINTYMFKFWQQDMCFGLHKTILYGQWFNCGAAMQFVIHKYLVALNNVKEPTSIATLLCTHWLDVI